MLLRTLIQKLGPSTVDGPLDRQIAGLAYDSRRVTPGMVFFAVPGLNVDGHEFIATAVERGAAAVICENNGVVPLRTTRIRVPDARQALARAAAAYYEHPSTRLKVIGVTGTNGKTIVCFMLKHMAEVAGLSAGLVSTIRYEVGERVIPAQRTTPEALEIQQMLASMVRARCDACVMEVSSHALEQSRVADISFDLAVFTNLTQDHLDYHGTMEAYFAAKRRLFEALRAGTKPGGAVINIDDAFGARLAKETTAEVRLTYGTDASARLRASKIELRPDGTRMWVEGEGGAFQCHLPLIGRHNVYNALAALGAGLVLEWPKDALRSSLESMPPVPGRLERLEHGQPFSVFVDYAHSESALRYTLSTLREIGTGRVLLAFGCGGSRDIGKRAAMGRAAAELADFTMITSDNPRRESPEEIAAAIEAGYQAARQDGYLVELDRRRAIDELIRRAEPGDTVLIAGKGHETYQEFQDTVIPFDDRQYARETLQILGYG